MIWAVNGCATRGHLCLLSALRSDVERRSRDRAAGTPRRGAMIRAVCQRVALSGGDGSADPAGRSGAHVLSGTAGVSSGRCRPDRVTGHGSRWASLLSVNTQSRQVPGRAVQRMRCQRVGRLVTRASARGAGQAVHVVSSVGDTLASNFEQRAAVSQGRETEEVGFGAGVGAVV